MTRPESIAPPPEHGHGDVIRRAAPVISMAAAPSGAGYGLVARDGGVFSFGFGDALAGASTPPLGGFAFAIDLAVRP